MPARVVRNISNTLSNTFRSRKRQRRSIHFDTDRLPRQDSDGDQEDMMGGSEEEEEGSGEELAGGRGGNARLINLQAHTPRRQTRRTGGTGVVRLQRRSSLPRRSSPHQNQSYRYQNSESTLLHPNNQHSLRTKEASTSNTALKPSQLSNATTQRRRQLRILSPLPVNHSIPRHLRHRHVMPHSPIAVGGKRLREPSGTPIRRVVRTRSSNTLVLSDERVKKRKRDAKMIVSDEEEAVETGEGESAGEEVEEDEWEEEEEEVPAARRLRSSDAKIASNSDHEEDVEEPEGDEEETAEEEENAEDSDVVEEGEDDIDMTLEGDQFHLLLATTSQLNRLRQAELAQLYSLATSESLDEALTLHKPTLVDGIISARPISSDVEEGSNEEEEVEEVEEEGEEEEEDDDEDSPRPTTSIDSSPAISRRKGRNSASARAGRGGKTKGGIRGKSKLRNVVAPSSSTGGSESEELVYESAEEEVMINENGSSPIASTSRYPMSPRTSRLRRGSQSLPALTGKPLPRQLRNVRRRSSIDAIIANGVGMIDLGASGRKLRNGKKVGGSRLVQSGEEESEEEEDGGEEEEEEGDGTPPVAHRTRHGAPVVTAPSSSLPAQHSRPLRQAALKAVAKIVRTKTSSHKGKERALDQDAWVSDDEVEVEKDEEQMDEEEDGIIEPLRRRYSRRGAHAREAPSDADDEEEEEDADHDEAAFEESEEEDEHEDSIEMLSARQLRNGKVVVLDAPRGGAGDSMETESDGGEEEDGEEDEEVEEDEMGDDEVDLAHATLKSLLRYRRDDLVRLCEEREIAGEGTKKDLVHALLEWRDLEDAESGESSSHSTLSAASNATARAETKTQALRAIPSHVSGTPLLMRRSFSRSPEKPMTLPQSKADEHEEVNALDLESLQLQDKEIAPEKLTRLEQVGSGGFKDVYKGLYRKKTIAISDIRGHLTEMDIKELGLLRDLRHPNIVHFIGVSIPKEPSSVPVMIVTELCANGDLFDYIRGVPHPSLTVMLEIMLGIAKGVDYLHTRKPTIIHRDIKSSNVLITAQGIAKINDFGLARVKTTSRSMIRSLVGTVNYQAPELWSSAPRYNESVDIYSVGLVFWEMGQWGEKKKQYPFEGMNEHEIYELCGRQNQRPSLRAVRKTLGMDISKLIERMWLATFAERPRMNEVVGILSALLVVEKDRVKGHH